MKMSEQQAGQLARRRVVFDDLTEGRAVQRRGCRIPMTEAPAEQGTIFMEESKTLPSSDMEGKTNWFGIVVIFTGVYISVGFSVPMCVTCVVRRRSDPNPADGMSCFFDGTFSLVRP